MLRNIKNFVSVLLIITLVLGITPVYAVDSEVSALDEMPYTAASGTFADTYAGNVSAYTASEAKEAGIPDGYNGAVIRVQPGINGAYVGCEFNFSSQEIPVEDIESITFRIYFPKGHTEMRLLGEKASGTWVMRANPESTGTWSNLTLDASGGNFMSGKGMADLANSDGNLGRICLIGRLDSGSDKSYYLDDIIIRYKSGTTEDTVAPMIIGDVTDRSYMVGERFSLDGISAYDEFDGRYVLLSESWSEGAVYSDGTLKVGEHTLTLTATDRSGNSASVTIKVSVKEDRSVIILDNPPTTGYIEGVSIYDGDTEYLTAQEAQAAGVPSGYTDGVLKVSSKSTRFGMTFDPTALDIPVGLIDRITIRILFYTDSNALRINNHGATEWMVLANATAGKWMEHTLSQDGSGFSNGFKLADLADEDGNLGIFSIATKDESGNNVFYIDNITINLKKDDNRAPVINYEGETDILTSSGKPFVLDATAVDELSGMILPLEYSFSDGAVDDDGNLVEGEHTCRVSATGYYGHTSYIDLCLTVGPKDVSAPEILISTEDIYAPAGAFWRVEILGIDDYDKVVVEEKWSKKPTDIGGRLVVGEYTLTLTCQDLSGNTTTKIVKLHVTADDVTVGQLIVCEKSELPGGNNGGDSGSGENNGGNGGNTNNGSGDNDAPFNGSDDPV